MSIRDATGFSMRLIGKGYRFGIIRRMLKFQAILIAGFQEHYQQEEYALTGIVSFENNRVC
jgi:hypothetical protein